MYRENISERICSAVSACHQTSIISHIFFKWSCSLERHTFSLLQSLYKKGKCRFFPLTYNWYPGSNCGSQDSFDFKKILNSILPQNQGWRLKYLSKTKFGASFLHDSCFQNLPLSISKTSSLTLYELPSTKYRVFTAMTVTWHPGMWCRPVVW
jgi:hypothetical protein